jgi:putative transposase
LFLASGGSKKKDKLAGGPPQPMKCDREDLLIYRRSLPHWRLEGSVYFVTWRLASSQGELTNEERGVVMAALKHFEGSRYEFYACVVMHDHVHALVKPLENHSLQKLVHSWKSFTAHRFRCDFGRNSPIWQDEYLDRIVRDEEEFLDKVQYVLNNPVKTWPELEDYPWAWIKEDLEP